MYKKRIKKERENRSKKIKKKLRLTYPCFIDRSI